MSYNDSIHSLPIPVIKIPDLLLRDIDQTREAFVLLVEDVRKHGIQVPLVVREVTTENGGKLYYLVEGRQRLGAAEACGLTEVPVRVTVCDDFKASMASIRLNLHRSQPSPAQHAHFLREVLLLNPQMSYAELASEIGQRPQWLRERLKLVDLKPEIQALVDSGAITPLNGVALAKLPEEEQDAFVDRAQKLPNVEFALQIAERKKTLDAARAKCKTAPAEGFTLFPLLRSKAELTAMRDLPASAPEIAELLNAAGVPEGDQVAAVKATIDWAWQIDPPTAEKRKAIWEADQARLKEEAARKKAENEERKLAADKLKAAEKEEKAKLDTARKVIMGT